MTEDRRQKMKSQDKRITQSSLLRPLSSLLPLGLCLCVLALRVTYTEAPIAQTMTLATSLTDTIYSLTVSGLLIFAFVGWLVYRFASNRPGYRVTGIEAGLILLGAAAVFASLGASDKRAAISHATILLAPILAALLLVQILENPGRVRLVLVIIVALGIVSAYQCAEQFLVSNAITIEQYEKDPNMLLSPLGIEPGTFKHFLFEHRLYSRGIRGFFTTSNSAASFALCASFAALALFAGRLEGVRNRGEKPRYAGFAFAAVALLVAGLFLTQSKGGIAAFFAGLAVFGLLMLIDRRCAAHKRRILAVLIPVALVLLVAVASFAVLYGLRHGRLPGGNSMLVRWQYWTASAQMVADHPVLGVGPGNFSDYYPHYKPAAALESVADPHSWPLSLITQYGPLGLLGFLAMLCLPLWRSILSPPADPSVDDVGNASGYRTLALSMLLILVLCLLFVRPLLIPTSGVDDFGIQLYEIMTLFITPAAAFLIGFLLVATPFEQGPPASTDRAGPALSASLLGAVVAVLLHNLIDFAIFEPGVWMTFWLLVACLIALRRHPDASSQTVSHRSSGRKWLAGAAAFALLGAYIHWIWLPVYRTTAGIQKSQQTASFGRPDLAHAALEEATRADPLSSVTASFNGRLYLQRYEPSSRESADLLDKAANNFREAIARSPADYKNYENLAITYNLLGRLQDAYDWYLKAAERYPGNERLQFELGQLAERLGRTEAALGHYAAAIEIEDRYREQFRRMYPERKEVVSRLGEKEYRLAQERIEQLGTPTP